MEKARKREEEEEEEEEVEGRKEGVGPVGISSSKIKNLKLKI